MFPVLWNITPWPRQTYKEDAPGRGIFGRAIPQADAIAVGLQFQHLISISGLFHVGWEVKVVMRQIYFCEYLGFYSVSIIPPKCHNQISFVFRQSCMILVASASVKLVLPLPSRRPQSLHERGQFIVKSERISTLEVRNKNVVQDELFADSPRVTWSGSFPI
jgi:hypothetical protein